MMTEALRIEVITVWYNEAFLAPFFLRHYAYADRITLFYDMDSTDQTLDIAGVFSNVHVIPFRFSASFSSVEKQQMINDRYRQSEYDWVLAVDADEFVFSKSGPDAFHADIRLFLHSYPGHDVYKAPLYTVYPHYSEAPLDPLLPAVPQRRHGNIVVPYGFIKPVLLRAGLADVHWWVGCHDLFGKGVKKCSQSPNWLLGAHWHKADLNMTRERILKNRIPRIGEDDKARKFSIHYTRESEASLLEEFARFAQAPKLF